MMYPRSLFLVMTKLALLGMFLVGAPAFHDPAFAAQPQPICSDDASFNTGSSGAGIVSTIESNVRSMLSSIAQDMFTGIEGDGNFQKAVAGVMTLYIAIYGAMFAMGMAQTTVYDFIVRLIKLALVSMLASGSMWSTFDQYVVRFFTTATDELIVEVTSIVVGGGASGSPVGIMDSAIGNLLSAKMIVHIMSMVTTGVYWIHALLLLIAMSSFLWSLLTGIWIYLMSLVMRTLLFGIAPIFLACLLFDRTKPLFLGWLNQLISVCLQPILLFTFFSFFILLIESTLMNVTSTPVCWTNMPGSVQGTSFMMDLWRSKLNNPDEQVLWGYDGPQVEAPPGTGTPPPPSSNSKYPVDVIVILMFLILSEISRQFNSIVLKIARDISVGGVDLASMRGALQGVFTTSGTALRSDNVGIRLNPDGGRAPISDRTAAERLSLLRDTSRMVTGRNRPDRGG